MDTKEFQMDDLDLVIHKISLKEANSIFSFVSNSVMKFLLGDLNIFGQLGENDWELIQKVMCKNIKHKSNDSNLSLGDLDEHIDCFLPLMTAFFEFNFGFFSKARRIIPITL